MWHYSVVILLELVRDIAAVASSRQGCFGGAVEVHGPVTTTINYILKPPPSPANLSMAMRVLAINHSRDDTSIIMNVRVYHPQRARRLASFYDRTDVQRFKEVELTSRHGLFVSIFTNLSPSLYILFTYTPFSLAYSGSRDCQFHKPHAVGPLSAYLPRNLPNPSHMSYQPSSNECGLDRQHSGTFSRPGFLCHESGHYWGWCIPRHLQCDGYDQCTHEEDEKSPICKQHPMSITTSQPEAQTCSPSTIQCPDGTCVREVAFCEKHPAKFCLGPWVHPCKKGGRCYSDEEKCNGWQNCGDGSDEFECNHNLLAIGNFIGKTWFFLVPAVILYFSLIVGCNWLLKQRKGQSDRASQFSRQETFQMTSVTISGTEAPPTYEEYMQMQTLDSSSELPPGEQELPPSYDEVTSPLTSTVPGTTDYSNVQTVNVSVI